MAKRMTFIVNPRGTRRASTRKRRTATKRKPPKGFRTWSAYMASIRPSSGGSKTMAKRKRRKAGRKATSARRRSVTRTNPVRHRRRYRRNPMGLSMGGVKNILLGGVVDAAFGVGGKAAVRLVRSKLGYDGATTIGAAVEVATATALGIAAAKVLGPNRARAVVQGAFMSPIENFIKSANLPYISATLGDEGDFAGIEEGMGGYPAVTGGPAGVRVGGGMGGYPAGLGDEEVGDTVYGY